MKLMRLPSNIRDVLNITQIAQVFDIYDDPDTGIDSFTNEENQS